MKRCRRPRSFRPKALSANWIERMSTKRSRLFAASTSLIGWGKSGKEYRLSHPAALPKFGKERVQAPNGAAGKLQAPGSGLHPASSEAQRRTGGNSKDQIPITQAAAPLKAKGPGPIAKWLAKLQGFIKRGKQSNKSAIPRFSAGPVQGELSLDNVKVMGNDLSETDLELV